MLSKLFRKKFNQKTKMNPKKLEYGAEQIKVLKGLEGVRHRPAMYIGGTGKEGLHHLVYEIVDNATDEVLAGFCNQIIVTINKDGSLTVEDNGRGIPVDIHPQYKKPGLEIVMTTLHAGGKFEHKAYAVSGGLHGVGASVVNALSNKLIATVSRNGKKYQQSYKRGNSLGAMKVIGTSKETGTIITFFPDDTIFSTLSFDYSVLQNRLRELAYLNPGLNITLKDDNKGKAETFKFNEGLMDFIKWVNSKKSVLHKPIYFMKEFDHSRIEVAIQYNDGYNENIFGFVNTINTVEGGTHVSGFKSALTRAINEYASKKGMLKNLKIAGDDVREGLVAILNMRIRDPQFEGQTKTKLGNSEIKGFVESIVSTRLGEFFEENPTIAKRVIQKALSAAQARNAAKKARELVRRKTALSVSGLPGKLADCSSKKFEMTELYIVEGESAGGCFAGDVKVALADGRNVEFKQLVHEHKNGKTNFCYTIKDNGSVGIAKIENPRITKKNVSVIRLTLDNGEEIVCTPDHKFMLRNGSYKEAKDLSKEDSLMPFHKRFSKIGGRITIDGYEMVWDQNKNWIFTHMLADECNLKQGIYSKDQGTHKHHIDFNKLNNNPPNIVRLSKEEHLLLHNEHLERTLHRADVKERAALAHQDPEYRRKISEWARQPRVREMLSKRAKGQWENPEYKRFMIKKFKEFYDSNAEYRKRNNQNLNEQQKKYWADQQNREKAAVKVKKFFEENPEAREHLSRLAVEQWKDEALILWRRQKTSDQWTPEFRKKRKEAYDKTIRLMKIVLERKGSLEKFDEMRVDNKDRSVLSMKTFCSRFFEDDFDGMLETVEHYNHKIRKIEWGMDKIDVYDLEVKETHNFALASGIFVHNSAKQARNKEFQAILPLKGKPLNVEKASPARVFSSEEIVAMITAIGTGTGEGFNLEKLRYGKIILMADADVDGQHIKTLLLTLLFRYFPKLIEDGRVYAAVSPLYRIRKGQSSYYVYSDDELKKMVAKMGGKPDVQRFKGLGEMNPIQLWDTTMDPKKRMLKRITIEDAVEADQVFSTLMGDQVAPRREFIEQNAKAAQLDI